MQSPQGTTSYDSCGDQYSSMTVLACSSRSCSSSKQGGSGVRDQTWTSCRLMMDARPILRFFIINHAQLGDRASVSRIPKTSVQRTQSRINGNVKYLPCHMADLLYTISCGGGLGTDAECKAWQQNNNYNNKLSVAIIVYNLND